MEGQRGPGRLRTIIYIVLNRPQTHRWRRRCLEWVEERGYDLVSLIEEDDEAVRPGLASGLTMLTGGEADVMVVADPGYLPDDWVPRLEVAYGGDPFAIPRPTNAPPSQRRAKPARRPGK